MPMDTAELGCSQQPAGDEIATKSPGENNRLSGDEKTTSEEGKTSAETEGMESGAIAANSPTGNVECTCTSLAKISAKNLAKHAQTSSKKRKSGKGDPLKSPEFARELFCEACMAYQAVHSPKNGLPGLSGNSSSLPRTKRKNSKSYLRTCSLPRGFSGSKVSSPRKKAIKDVVYYIFGCGSSKSQKVEHPAAQFQLKDEIAEVTAEMECMDVSEEKHNPKSKHLAIGRKKFNMDPKKGIEYLIEHNLLQRSLEEVAQFLYKGEGLNKTAIGDYLGERNDFNIDVLKAFVNLHEFSDMILVQALRQFLWSFRLPGEAQKIDRMMECFAQRYCELNPGVFNSTDTCYVLSFAIIMLNTSLHNPCVKDKPSVDRFIDMNRGINDGGNLPAELLISLYESIKKEPFKIPEDDGNDLMHTFFNPDKEGWLWKQGTSKFSGRYKSWKRRWFILNDNCLYYFEFTTDKEPKGIIPLENIQVREIPDRNKPNCFELFSSSNDVIKACKTDTDGKVVEGKHSVYRMSAAAPEEKEDWISCIRASIAENPFYDMLAARRKKAQHVNN